MNGNVKVLVVENEMPVAMMVVSLLTRIGFEVQVATKARKGLEIAQEEKFDLIILETNLPGISSFEIFEDLRQRHISYRTPVVFLSNPGGDEYREQALELGAADFIEKPFDAKDFISRILSVVEETTLA
jgi:two-component system copper resistance phosphate regulon response regulator CusR